MRRLYIFIVILTLTTFISGNIYASRTYIIKKGDTPSRIAKKFKVRTQDIIKVNNLRPDNLKPGTKITIPVSKKEAPHKNKLNPPGSPNNPPIPPLTDSSYHTVKKGDTLFSLSKKYSISTGELKEINNLRSTRLKPGQQLIVKKMGPKTYTVRKGDNIYRISRRFNIGLDELMDINSLESDLLKPGQKILLEHDLESEPKNYEAILSQSHIKDETKKISESEKPVLKELSMKERLILFAKNLLNIPYRFGGSSLLGIDCSAYVQKVYSLIGINLPRSAREQFSEGNPVDKEELSIGDLVFFRTYASFPSHVGIYLGNNLFIHASSRARKVTIDSLETPFYLERFIGAKRLIEEDDKS
jgi:LysM repeat protein